jgi:hypothetical protein
MSLPRVRFTVRRLMVGVAVAALTLGIGQCMGRQARFSRYAKA